ncbi:MAG: GDP-mannose 4,6-dehydratase [candidate division Zixibacteria bacterium]|nr:GDP-mannose 4,6-dehydratase [candidate division Zixibacteria bacterium]
MRSLITGGAGFIGSHLAEELLKRKDEVSIIDNLSTGKLENVEHLNSNPKFHLVVDTVLNESLMRELIEKCDMVYHLAAAVGVRFIIEKPVETIETNILGTEMILKLANLYKKKVLITSTSEVYGKSTKVPFKEGDDRIYGPTTKSRWSYASSKAVDEFLALAYFQGKKLPTVIARLFNTIGPRQTGRYGMVVPTMVQQALLGHPITVHSDGKQTRSFTYVSDVVEALIRLANHPEAVGQVFNVGSEEEITINALALLIKKMTNSKSKIIHVPYSQAYEKGFEDMRQRVPDIGKIERLIGFKPKVKLQEALQKVIEYYRR